MAFARLLAKTTQSLPQNPARAARRTADACARQSLHAL